MHVDPAEDQQGLRAAPSSPWPRGRPHRSRDAGHPLVTPVTRTRRGGGWGWLLRFGEGCGLQLPGRQRQPASPVAVSILELHLSPRRQGGGKAPNIINACDTPCPPPTPPAALLPLSAAPQASLVSGSSCVPSTAGYRSVLSDRPVLDACGAANSIISRFLLNFRTPETRVKTGPLVAAARTPHPRHRSAHGSPKWIHAHPNFPVRVESPHKK